MKDADDWFLAGEIIARVRREAEKSVRAGKRLPDIAEELESRINKEGAKPAFPINISINDVAAHYTPGIADDAKVPNNALVKVDLGANVRGALSDTAITVVVGNPGRRLIELVKATREVLEEALEVIKDGTRIGDISTRIWKGAHQRGFGVIVDLGGHSLERWKLHAGVHIPNVPIGKEAQRKLREGMIIAIEPFLVSSNEDSETKFGRQIQIFSISKLVRGSKVLEIIWARYKTLPFAIRWLTRSKETANKLMSVLKKYMERGIVIGYPVLLDARGNFVAQFEHTVLVKRNSCEILTG